MNSEISVQITINKREYGIRAPIAEPITLAVLQHELDKLLLDLSDEIKKDFPT